MGQKKRGGFAHGKTRRALNRNRQLVLALVKDIELIGEAAVSVSAPTKKMLPEVTWSEIIAMRNRLIHAYFNINLDILWKTVVEDLPPLIAALGNIIPRVEADGNYE